MNEQSRILAEIVQLVGQQSASQSLLNEAITEQTKAIQHVPSRRELALVNLVVALMIVLVVGVSGFLTLKATLDSRSVGRLNSEIISTFCRADPTLAECVLEGSDTTKASAILSNCRLWSNISAASSSPVVIHTPTDASCRALGFPVKESNV